MPSRHKMIPGEENKKVSIIVVNWNGEGFLNDCLSALSDQTYANYEIILVDNGSSDNSVCLTREKFPQVKIAALRENKGFTGGNAAGLEVAQGPYIALVNNDARPDKTWLENLLQPMLRDRSIGICASKLIFENSLILNSAGDGITTAAVGFNRGLGKDPALFNGADLVFSACGAAVLYRRRMLAEIGFLDDNFFLYDEDTDLSFRAQLAGWKCVYVPNAIAFPQSQRHRRPAKRHPCLLSYPQFGIRLDQKHAARFDAPIRAPEILSGDWFILLPLSCGTGSGHRSLRPRETRSKCCPRCGKKGGRFRHGGACRAGISAR